VATGEAKVYALPFPCDETMLRAMLTRNGGEALTLPPPN
jgi:hypothetical protein